MWVDARGAVAIATWERDSAELVGGPVAGRLLDATLADVDGDGVLDVVTAHGEDEQGSLRWLSGRELAEVGSPREHVLELVDALGGPARSAVFGRFDRDASMDALLLGDTHHVLVSATTPGPARPLPQRAGVLGTAWVAMKRPYSHQHAVLAVLPSGELTPVQVEPGAAPRRHGHVMESAIPPGSTLHVGDVDGDGRTDLVAVGTDTATLVRNVLRDPKHESVELATAPHGSAVGDVDGDGLDDLLTWDDMGEIGVLRWPRGAPPESGPLLHLGTGIASVVVHDLDRNGLPDLAIATSTGPTHIVLANCTCAEGWLGARCDRCADPDCTSAGGELGFRTDHLRGIQLSRRLWWDTRRAAGVGRMPDRMGSWRWMEMPLRRGGHVVVAG